jgi:hypothetical protein
MSQSNFSFNEFMDFEKNEVSSPPGECHGQADHVKK